MAIGAPEISQAGSLQVSGGVDGRYINTNGNDNDAVLQGAFLNFRKIFSDESGDRWIAVGQLDADDNFKKIRPYQTYIQYKGPLGKWNIRAGHYILPFGLLSDYDSERLLLKTIEDVDLGIKLDTGAEVLGYLGDFDYAVSVSQGTGQNRLTDVDNDKLVVSRIGWQKEDINIGLSALIGEVLTEEDSIIREDLGKNSFYAKRLGIDVTRNIDRLTLRAELSGGVDDKKDVEGGLLKADYALTSKLELNLKYAYWQREGSRNFGGAGISYQLFQGVFLRIADEYEWGKEDKNVAALQTYFEFTRQF
ncbi:MAG: hypothetical protein KGJ11_00410 [Candidatus Omnitrophica bacterium]|nr:hypothetical protein [Candidatus Omnitrophota bacterium]